jgi:DNA invertase Pin-like site-specific DNA recombinase
MTKKNVISLLRVSSDQQDVRRQRDDIKRVKAKYDLAIIRTLELVDVSGTTVLSNEQVQRVLADLADPNVDGIAVSSVDRLFRPGRYGHFAILDHFCDEGKAIWSTREGFIDPASDEGYDKCISAGGRAGAELRELRRRTLGGKETLRREGKHVQGPAALPRGVAFDKATGQWSYQEPDCSLVARMYLLLLAGDSYHTIAAKVGGGWTFQGVRSTLRNPIWAFGTRTYPANAYREEAYTVKVIDTPLVPVDVWEAAQREMDRRKRNWHKTKRPPRHLVVGLLDCICGKPFYIRCAAKKDYPRKKDYGYCSSAFPGRGPKCGARSWQVEQLDAAVERLVSETLCQVPVLRTILSAIVERQPHTADACEKAEKEIRRLDAKRARIVDLRADGLITREECTKRLSAVDQELHGARAAAAAVQNRASDIDLEALARGLAGAFALFASLPFDQKRDLLRRAVWRMTINDGAIPSITIRGGFLCEILESNVGANLSPHSRWRYWHRCRGQASRPRQHPLTNIGSGDQNFLCFFNKIQ